MWPGMEREHGSFRAEKLQLASIMMRLKAAEPHSIEVHPSRMCDMDHQMEGDGRRNSSLLLHKLSNDSLRRYRGWIGLYRRRSRVQGGSIRHVIF